MTEEDMTDTKPTITSAEPQLFVSDIKSSCAFFADKLGFAVVFTYGEPPFYALVKRGGASLTLRQLDAPAIDPALRDREELLSASLTVATRADIEALYREYQASGVTFFQPLKDEPWGARDFIVSDIDGNLLLFAGPGT
jgi:catechol 2,3-dioxygenase-like lactoylglutathione lyase family enzyme